MVQGDLVPKTTSTIPTPNTNANTVLQDTEEKEKAKPTEVKTEEGEDSQNVVVGMESEIGTKATITGRRRGRPSETLDQPKPIIETAPEATSLIINTPRLAKQRAIKNNREMHMKQRRKRRKAPATAEEATPSAPELPPDSTPPTASALPTVTTQPQPSLDGVPTSSTASVCKRGRPPRLPPGKRGRGKGVGKQSSKKAATTALITGPKKKRNREITNNSTVETSKKIHKLKARHRKQRADHVTITAMEEKKEEEKRPDVPLKHKLQEPERNAESDRRSFRPYVRINSSDDLLPHCIIINRPEEDQLLHRARRLKKMRLSKAKNPSVITKAAMATSSAMLEGPLVNSSLSGSIPRKALAFGPKLECREEGERAEEPGEALSTDKPLKSDAIPKGPGRRGRGGPGDGGVRGLEWARAGFRRLQLEAESKEHWAHEACAIWTNGVILIAGKLYGLTEAIHAAAHTQCSACQAVGASISCSREGCSQIFHFVCAKDTGCLLQEDNFSLKCTKHKDV
ncbi:hypothetical protein AGOR_G00221460 [Albula goreensis]|uniref:PHD-type domain-containing protein n=1 Tax=Albula goreensis TaxID=1534307 RepID=A0A8T3CFV3_9TELE|nr:hypothetical protein AGOR_G00221460 [Albula goreensis]